MTTKNFSSQDTLPRAWDQEIDTLLLAFEDAWSPGDSPEVEEFVAQHLPQDSPETVRLVALSELARADFELSLASSGTVRAGDYLVRHAPLRCSPAIAAEFFVLEYNFRKDHSGVTRAEFLADVPREFREAVANRLAHEPRYVANHYIGAGGQGEVWRSYDLELGRKVAVKTLREDCRDDPGAWHSLVSEARITSELEHPGIVPVYGLEENSPDGRPRYAMRYVQGDTLSARIHSYHDLRSGKQHQDLANANANVITAVKPTPSPSEVRLRFRELLSNLVAVCKTVAFAHAHARVFIHRDLKPDNVMVGEFGETIVMDWGLARPLANLDQAMRAAPSHPHGESAKFPDQVITQVPSQLSSQSPSPGQTTVIYDSNRPPDSILWDPLAGALRGLRTSQGERVGTPGYMSPEQSGAPFPLDQRTDVYGLGGILYCILTDRPPHPPLPDETLEEMLDRVQQQPVQPPRQVATDVPRPLDAICSKALALHPKDRYSSAAEVALELECYLADEPVRAYRESQIEQLWRLFRKYPRRIVGGAVAGLAAAVLAVFLMWYIPHTNAVSRRLSLIESLASQETQAFLYNLGQMRPDDPLAGPITHELQFNLNRAVGSPDDIAAEKKQRRFRLALLRFAPTQQDTDWLFHSLDAIDDWDELRLTSDLLIADLNYEVRSPHVARLWSKLADVSQAPDRRLRAACALARLDASNPLWQQQSEEVTRLLIGTNAQTAAKAVDLLRPVRQHLHTKLINAFRDYGDQDAGQIAAAAAAQYAMANTHPGQETLTEYVNLLLDASPAQHVILLDNVTPTWRALLLPALLTRLTELQADEQIVAKELGKDPHAGTASAEEVARLKKLEHVKDLLASQQANAAAGLLRLEPDSFPWGLLRHSPDPRVRTLLILRIPVLRIPCTVLVAALDRQGDADFRAALIPMIGQYPSGDVPTTASQQLKHFFREGNAAEHAAARWALARLGEEAWVQQELQSGATKASHAALPPDNPPAKRNWWVNSEGHVMVVVPAQKKGEKFWVGARAHEKAYESAGEPRKEARIDRAFAISATETMVAQMERCFREVAGYEAGYRKTRDVDRAAGDQSRPEDAAQQRQPIGFVPVVHAMYYCNWLSKRAGIPEDQWCYDAEALAEYLNDPNDDVGINSKVAYRADATKTGYRLPTEVEWEYGCRAMSDTARFYGYSPSLLKHYALHRGNSEANVFTQVADKMPNALGLFDTLGNVGEWCQNNWITSTRTPSDNGQPPLSPLEAFEQAKRWPLRGGTLNDEAAVVRCSYRIEAPIGSQPPSDFGFRVVRTLPDEAPSGAGALPPENESKNLQP